MLHKHEAVRAFFNFLSDSSQPVEIANERVSALNVVSGLALSTGAEDAAVLPESSLGMHHDMTASVTS